MKQIRTDPFGTTWNRAIMDSLTLSGTGTFASNPSGSMHHEEVFVRSGDGTELKAIVWDSFVHAFMWRLMPPPGQVCMSCMIGISKEQQWGVAVAYQVPCRWWPGGWATVVLL